MYLSVPQIKCHSQSFAASLYTCPRTLTWQGAKIRKGQGSIKGEESRGLSRGQVSSGDKNEPKELGTAGEIIQYRVNISFRIFYSPMGMCLTECQQLGLQKLIKLLSSWKMESQKFKLTLRSLF